MQDALVDERAQARGQGRAVVTRRCHQFLEAACAEEDLAQHERGPAIAERLERHRDLAAAQDRTGALRPDTPTIYETEPPSDEALKIIDSLVALGQTGRAMIASPKMTEDRVTALREGFACAVEDPELAAEMEKQQRPLNALDGDEIAQLVDDVLDSPEAFRKLVVASY